MDARYKYVITYIMFNLRYLDLAPRYVDVVINL